MRNRSPLLLRIERVRLGLKSSSRDVRIRCVGRDLHVEGKPDVLRQAPTFLH
jgi:hypothetical protein